MTERDDTVSKRYRELPAEEPPRALDEAILAASRRAARTRPAPLVAPAGRQRWYVPLAAAAVIVLAVGLTLRMQLEPPAAPERVEVASQPQVLKEETARIVEEDTSKRKLQDEAREKAQQEARAAAARARQEAKRENEASAPVPAEPKAAVAAAAPPAAAKPAPAASPMSAETRMPGRADDTGARDRAERQLSSVAGEVAAKRMAAPDETPEKALERIAELRKEGKHDEADKALAEFRKRYPDYKIPEKTLERVERR